MPVKALKATSIGRNGVGAYILQCKKIDFHFCDWAGSSRGMNAFLKHNLAMFSKVSPSVEIHVSPRPNHAPVLRGHYVNGAMKQICVGNMPREEVLQKAIQLRDASGEKTRKIKSGHHVRSLNENVRGVWSPVHEWGNNDQGVWAGLDKTKRMVEGAGKRA